MAWRDDAPGPGVWQGWCEGPHDGAARNPKTDLTPPRGISSLPAPEYPGHDADLPIWFWQKAPPALRRFVYWQGRHPLVPKLRLGTQLSRQLRCLPAATKQSFARKRVPKQSLGTRGTRGVRRTNPQPCAPRGRASAGSLLPREWTARTSRRTAPTSKRTAPAPKRTDPIPRRSSPFSSGTAPFSQRISPFPRRIDLPSQRTDPPS